MTETSKPVLVPINQALLGPGDALDACRNPAVQQLAFRHLRSLWLKRTCRCLPHRISATLRGEHGPRAARSITKATTQAPASPTKSTSRLQGSPGALANCWMPGGPSVAIVTDHGWILLPSGLPKNEGLPAATAVAKKGRCARLKDGAAVDIPTVPWHWDTDVRIAIAPGISCFEANQTYEHGGVSPQECFVPRLTVATAAATASARAEITSIKWRGLTLVVEFADLPDGAKVDLRRQAGDTASSIADWPGSPAVRQGHSLGRGRRP